MNSRLPVDSFPDVDSSGRLEPSLTFNFEDVESALDAAKAVTAEAFRQCSLAIASATTAKETADAMAEFTAFISANRHLAEARREAADAQINFLSGIDQSMRGRDREARLLFETAARRTETVAERMDRFAEATPRSKTLGLAVKLVLGADSVVNRIEMGVGKAAEVFAGGVIQIASKVRTFAKAVAGVPDQIKAAKEAWVAKAVRTRQSTTDKVHAGITATATATIGVASGFMSRLHGAVHSVTSSLEAGKELINKTMDSVAEGVLRLDEAIDRRVERAGIATVAAAKATGTVFGEFTRSWTRAFDEHHAQGRAASRLNGAQTPLARPSILTALAKRIEDGELVKQMEIAQNVHGCEIRQHEEQGYSWRTKAEPESHNRFPTADVAWAAALLDLGLERPGTVVKSYPPIAWEAQQPGQKPYWEDVEVRQMEEHLFQIWSINWTRGDDGQPLVLNQAPYRSYLTLDAADAAVFGMLQREGVKLEGAPVDITLPEIPAIELASPVAPVAPERRLARPRM
jgi:hypothetical protein